MHIQLRLVWALRPPLQKYMMWMRKGRSCLSVSAYLASHVQALIEFHAGLMEQSSSSWLPHASTPFGPPLCKHAVSAGDQQAGTFWLGLLCAQLHWSVPDGKACYTSS